MKLSTRVQFVVHSLAELAKELEIIKKGTLPLGALMRGEAKAYDFPAMPDMLRPPSGSASPLTAADFEPLTKPITVGGKSIQSTFFTKQELGFVQDFQEEQLDDSLFSPLIDGNSDCPSWLAFMKHYGRPTRLVDVTRDPLVAAYFACKSHPEESGYILLYTGSVARGDNVEDYRRMYDRFLEEHLVQKHLAGLPITIPDYLPREQTGASIYCLLPAVKSPTRRMLAQRGELIFGCILTQSLVSGTWVFEIPSDAKADILSQLGAWGIDEHSLFPD